MDVFDQYLPATAAIYGRQLWQQHHFQFRVSKPRRTRLGDFKALPGGSLHVSVNADLNPYSFLLTYIHEVAHVVVHRQTQAAKRRTKPKPHGPHWRLVFQQLMQPVLTEAVYPLAILEPLRDYMSQPAATSFANPTLISALRQADPKPVGQVLLQDVPEGQAFRFAKKTFVRGTFRRTRIVCKEVVSGKSYTILAHALVVIMNDV